jgi:type IV secretory pathway VirB2 component (pilin)
MGEDVSEPKESRMKKTIALAAVLVIAAALVLWLVVFKPHAIRSTPGESKLAAAQTAKVMSGPFDEALARAKKENKLILIDFFSGG